MVRRINLKGTAGLMNKKRIYLRLLTVLLIVAVLLPVSGAVLADGLPRVVDNAFLLSNNEANELSERIDRLIEDWSFDIVILTMDGIGSKTVEEYADDFFDYNGYGIGASRDGIILLIDMDSRMFHYGTNGYGIMVFTDYGLEYIDGEVTPYLSKGDYFGAFGRFIDLAEAFLVEAEADEPYDDWNPVGDGSDDPNNPWPTDPGDYYYPNFFERLYYNLGYFIIMLIPGGLISLIVVLIMRGKMNTARPKPHAAGYVKDGLELTVAQDVYLYSTTSRSRRATESSSGGSSTHTSSSGGSHGGRSGSF